jgi:chromosomal replication initiation ATPase DnaA
MTEASPRQLTFALEGSPRLTAEDYLVERSNAPAHALVTSWPNWPSHAVLLYGQPGSGKSHLAAIWAELAGARIATAAQLREADIAALPAGFQLAVEDIDSADVHEEVLFHLLNTAREREGWLLLTSATEVTGSWPRVRDLSSRLRAMPRADLSAPGDELVRAVLVKLFDDRQLAVDVEVIDYVARRMERSIGSARRLVAELDQEALALGRGITRPVAAAVLARLSIGED